MSLFWRSTNHQRHQQASDLIPRRAFPGSTFIASVSTDSAEQVIAYEAAVNLLANIVSSLPMGVYVGRGTEQRPAAKPAWLDDPGGAGYGIEDWLKQFVHSCGFTGNAIISIESRDGNGTPRVLTVRDMAKVYWSPRTGWRLGNDRYPNSEIVHYRRWPRAGHRFGSSPIERHATTIGMALSAERFGRQWFDEGAHPSATLESEEWLDADETERLKARLLEPNRGTREPIILGGGLKLKAWQVAPNESQFLETQGYTASQVCRILGPGLAEILGYATGDSSTYKNREQVALDLLAYTVDPWLTDIEKLLSRLMGEAQGTFDGRYVQFDRSALLRTDLKTRFEAYRIALGPAEPFMTANEVRRPEPNLPPVSWGDAKPTIQGENNTDSNGDNSNDNDSDEMMSSGADDAV